MKNYSEDKTVVRFPAWDYDVDVVFSTNVDASIKRRDDNHEEGTARAICMRSQTHPRCLIIFPYRPKESTVAHESWHAVRRMLTYCGAEYDSETVAYHLGYLVQEITKFSRKHPRPKIVRKTDKSPEPCVECGQVGFHKMSCDTRGLDNRSQS